MKAPVRITASKTHLGPKKRRDAHPTFTYPHTEVRGAGTDASRALQADHPGCPRRVLLSLVALEAFRSSKTPRRRRITPQLLAAALVRVLGGTRARPAA